MSTTFSTDSTANATPLTLDSALSAQVQVLGDALREKGWTVSSAESCTGGGVAFAFTSVAGSSDWFNQSWVTYSNDAKRSVLGVTEQTLKEYGAVSKQTVKEMAEGVRRVGASKASLISTLGPPATAIMAQELTGETLAPAQWLGIALVLIGVMALEVRRQRPT